MRPEAVGPPHAPDLARSDEFRQLFAAHRLRLARLALLLGGDRGNVDDLVADVFAAMYPHWLGGTVADPASYLRRTMVNLVIGGGRRQNARLRWEGRARPAPRVHDLGAGVVERRRLETALANLSPELRQTVVLRFYEDLSEAETAELLGVAVGTVKSRTARALARLRPLLEDDDD